jgi:hypothetical protein
LIALTTFITLFLVLGTTGIIIGARALVDFINVNQDSFKSNDGATDQDKATGYGFFL